MYTSHTSFGLGGITGGMYMVGESLGTGFFFSRASINNLEKVFTTK